MLITLCAQILISPHFLSIFVPYLFLKTAFVPYVKCEGEIIGQNQTLFNTIIQIGVN
jgi:hypothetical protein